MTKYMFRWALAILVTIMISLLSAIGQHSPAALANRAQQSDRDRLATKMLDPVIRRADRMYDLCTQMSTAAVQFRMESLVPRSTCERIRAAKNDVIPRMRTMVLNGSDDDVKNASRIIDEFMIESAPTLQTMEEAHATVNRIMRQAGRS